MVGGGLGPGAADQVVTDEAQVEFLEGHFARAAAQHFHLEGGFEVIPTHFQPPAPQLRLENLWFIREVWAFCFLLYRRSNNPLFLGGLGAKF
jgi:hypothetical protein